jgi:hypothetical protein
MGRPIKSNGLTGTALDSGRHRLAPQQEDGRPGTRRENQTGSHAKIMSFQIRHWATDISALDGTNRVDYLRSPDYTSLDERQALQQVGGCSGAGACAHPGCCESSQIGNSHHEAAWKLVAPEVHHGNREIHSRVSKFAQNLHVVNMAVEAEKEGLEPCLKHVRLSVFRRPARRVLYVAQRPFVLQ